MNQAILDAKGELEAAGLQVKFSGARSLWIAATTKEVVGGIRLSNDTSALIQRDDNWVAVFPAGGTLNYEVSGELQDLLALIQAVYSLYHRMGGPFKDAFKQSVSDSEPYLVGRFSAEDEPHTLPPSQQVNIGTGEGLIRCETTKD